MDSPRTPGTGDPMIRCADPGASYRAHQAEIDEALHGVLKKGHYILGEQVAAFEEEFSAYSGVSFGIGVGSGTEALEVALRVCGVGSGDEVITVAHTAAATVAAIEAVGATPVFVDIEPTFYTLNPALLSAVITPRTRVIIPVHLYGHPADMEPIMRIARQEHLRVIEDCAQAAGASYQGQRVGSLGDLACFSFYPTKNLGAIGDGGIVITNDSTLAHQARLIREYGWRQRYISEQAGINTRLDELQAAILRVKLPYLDLDNATRALLAARYVSRLAGMDLAVPVTRPGSSHVFHLFVVQVNQREQCLAYLAQRGVQALVHYPAPLHRQPAYKKYARSLPVTEAIASTILSLPLYPQLESEAIDTVCNTLQEFTRNPAYAINR